MIPLRFDQGGSFFVGGLNTARTCWLCDSPECVSRILTKPALLRTRSHAPAPDRSVLRHELEQYLFQRARTMLVRIQKSGLIIHGSQRVKNCPEQNIIAIIFSNDVGPRTRTDIVHAKKSVETYVFPDTSAEIGRLLGRGPRSTLALQRSRRTQSLIDTLRVGCSLG